MEKFGALVNNSFNSTKNTFRWRLVKRKKQVLNFCMGLVFTIAVGATPGFSHALEANALPECAGGCLDTHNIHDNTLDVKVGSYSKFNYDRFNIGTAATVNLNGTAGSVYVAKINGSNGASEILGHLNGPGITAFLMNSAGITFGAGSIVNLGSLVATTAGDVDLDSGKYEFTDFGNAAVKNDGYIKVSNGGFAVLAAPKVENTGTVIANLGRIELASTDNLSIDARMPGTPENIAAGTPTTTVDFRGDDLITYSAATGESAEVGITNTGILQAQSGYVKISAKLASSVIDSVINLDGIVDVDAFPGDVDAGIPEDIDAGKVIVSSTVGDINVIGNIKASGAETHSSSLGGKVEITSAKRVNVTSDSSIKANGGVGLNGVGLNEVKITGHDVVFNGDVEIIAENGDTGILTINQTSAGALSIRSGSAVATDTNVIYEAALERILQKGTSVHIITGNETVPEDESGVNNSLTLTGSIIVENLTDNELKGGKESLVLMSNAISFVDKSDTIVSTSGNVVLIGGSGGIDIGSISTNSPIDYIAGDIYLLTVDGGDIKAVNLSLVVDDNNVSKVGSGYIGVTSDGNVEINGDTKIAIGNDTIGFVDADAYLSIKAKKDILINGNIDVSAKINVPATSFTDTTFNSSSAVEITALGNNTLNSNVTVNAAANTLSPSDVTTEARFVAVAGAEVIESADPDVAARIEFSGPARVTALGNLSIAGTTNVTSSVISSADPTLDSNDVESSALVLRVASGNVSVNGNTKVNSQVTSDTNIESGAALVTVAGISATEDNTYANLTHNILDNKFTLSNEGNINITGDNSVISSAVGIVDKANKANSGSFNVFAASKNTKITGKLSTIALSKSNFTPLAIADTRLSAGMDAFSGSALGNLGELDVTTDTIESIATTNDPITATANMALIASGDVIFAGDNVPMAKANLVTIDQSESMDVVNERDGASIQVTAGSGDGLFFNAAGWSVDGINKTTRTEFDTNNYDVDGFNPAGWNIAGINKTTGTEFDLNNRDVGGFNPAGWSVDGINKTTGTEFDTRGFNVSGFNTDGFNAAGFDADGFDAKGFNLAGLNRETGTQYNASGFDKFGNLNPNDKQTASVINSENNIVTFTDLSSLSSSVSEDNSSAGGGALSIRQLQNIEPGAGNADGDTACSAMNCGDEETKG